MATVDSELNTFDPQRPTRVSVIVGNIENGDFAKQQKKNSSSKSKSKKNQKKLNKVKIRTIEEQRRYEGDEELTMASTESTLNKNSNYDKRLEQQRRSNSKEQQQIVKLDNQKNLSEGLEYLCNLELEDALVEESRADSESTNDHHRLDELRMESNTNNATTTTTTTSTKITKFHPTNTDLLDTVFETVEHSMGCGDEPLPRQLEALGISADEEEIVFDRSSSSSSTTSVSLPMLAGEQIDDIENVDSVHRYITSSTTTMTTRQGKCNPKYHKDVIDEIFESELCWCSDHTDKTNDYPTTEELASALSNAENEKQSQQHDCFDYIFEPVESVVCDQAYQSSLYSPFSMLENGVKAFTAVNSIQAPCSIPSSQEVKESRSESSRTGNKNRQLVAVGGTRRPTPHQDLYRDGERKDLIDTVFDTIEGNICGNQGETSESLLLLTQGGKGDEQDRGFAATSSLGGGGNIKSYNSSTSSQVQRVLLQEWEKPVLPEPEDDLLWLVAEQQDCLKCAPVMFLTWLYVQDIVTVVDLRDACLDNQFVEYELIPNGGLKRYKRGKFVRAIETAAIAQLSIAATTTTSSAAVAAAAASINTADGVVPTTNSMFSESSVSAFQRANSL